MNIDYLYSFIEVVNKKSLSKASEQLNLSQPALGKQIRKLEDYFNCSLLNRTTSGVELSEAGELVYNQISQILKDLESLQAKLDQMKNMQTYSIGTLPSLMGNYMPVRLIKLKKKGLNVKVVVKNTSKEVYDLLKVGELDAAVIEGIPNSKPFWQRELFNEPLYAVVQNTHKLAEKKFILIEEISDQDFVLYPPNCTIRQSISCQIKELKVKTEVEFGEFLLGFVAAGEGITVVPEITAKFMGHSQVKAIPIRNTILDRHISLISQSLETGKLLYSVFKENGE